MDTKSRSVRKIAIIVIAGILLLSVPLIYFFGWRASDNDYVNASQYVDYMSKTNKTITVELSAIKHPGLINQTTPLKLNALSSNYVKMHEALEANSAVAHDFTVSGVYNKHKSALAEYTQSLLTLTKSIKLYTSVLGDCKKVTDSLVGGYNGDAFKSLLSACKTAIEKGENDSQHKPFNDQFFSEYLNETALYMTSIEKLVNTTTNDETNKVHAEMEVIYDKINKLGAIEFNFGLPNLTAAYGEIASSLDSQKKSFFR